MFTLYTHDSNVDMRRTSLLSLHMTPPSSAGFLTTVTMHTGRKVIILLRCTENNPLFNVSKTKKLIVDFRNR